MMTVSHALRGVVTSASLLTLLLALAADCAWAFPLDPVRIFARDISPAAGKLEVEASVWQDGEPFALDQGQRIYVEEREVETDAEGRFDFWLGEGKPVEGQLKGEQFGLNQKLRLQLHYRVPGSEQFRNVRLDLSPIDNAYIASHTSAQPLSNEAASRGAKLFKPYEPKFRDFAPELVRRGLVTLYPDGRLQTEDGSFVETTGTTTSGVQEFFDYCTEHHVDGYIMGGSLPHAQQVVYQIWTPLHMHPAQGIRIDTGAITLQFMPELGDQPGLTIDSCMMNDIRIRGLLHYMGSGYALSIKPANPLPLDRFVGNTIVDTIAYVTSIACRDARGAIEFDGSVNFCRFEFNEINHGGVGIHVAPGSSFSNNRITCKHVHGQTGASILDEAGAANVWEVNVNCDGVDPLGIVTSGRDSLWFTSVNSRTRPGLVLERAASGNQLFLMGLNGGYDNRAENPTNRFYASPGTPAAKLHLGYAVETPPVPASGELVVNRNPFPVVVMFKSPGSVAQWELNDPYGAAERFEGPLASGQTIYLAPAEAIRLHFAGYAPSWRWRAVQ
ncbi:MAG: hypothetical protein AB7G28_10535 [Pirellulales bacterium]